VARCEPTRFGRTPSTIIAEAKRVVYTCGHSYTLETVMGRTALIRTNLLLEAGKVRRLRKALHSRSNSEAVRRVIDERLAVETGLGALQTLRKLGGPEDVFGRASAKKR
jgi:hypothetical protein